MIREASLAVALALLAGCAVDQAAVDARTQRIEPRVARDCAAADGVKAGNTLAGSLVPVPGAAVAAIGLNAGVDAACADPAQTAGVIATLEEAAHGLLDRIQAR